MKDEIRETAPAKINLSLDIRGRFDDGYHRLESIMQSVDLCDDILLTGIDEGIELKVRGNDEVPSDSSNLAWQAANLLQREYEEISCGLRIELFKSIPVAAGLAGGSADAAAVIRGINRMFSLGLAGERMEELGFKLGADVPFCVRGGTALARSRGEKLTSLPHPGDHTLLLVKPRFSLATAEIFAGVDDSVISAEVETSRLVEKIRSGRAITWQEGWQNVLERVALKKHPSLQDLREKIASHSPAHIQMTGSGPTFMAFFSDSSELERAIANWRGEENLFKVNFRGG